MQLLIRMGLAAWKQAASIYFLQSASCRWQTTPAHGLDGMSEPCDGARGDQPPYPHLYRIPWSMGQRKSKGIPARGTGSPARADPEQVMDGRKAPHP